MKKEIELAYTRLPKLLNTYGFSKAYIKVDHESTRIVLCEQKKPLSLQEWCDLETLIKLDIARNVSIIGKEQEDNYDGYLLIKGSEDNA
jgi:hypothetical protein